MARSPDRQRIDMKSRTAARRQWRSRAGTPFPFCTAECRPWPAGIVASLSEPAGRVSTRPAGRGRSEGTGEAGGAAGGVSLSTFLVATRKVVTLRGETRPIIFNRRQAPNRTAKNKTPAPGVRRGDESADRRPARQQSPGNEHAAPYQQRRSRAGTPFPFCTAECWPWPAGIVASLSEPAGRVSTRPAGRGRSEGTGEAGGAAGGVSLSTFLVATRKVVARRGETRPIIFNRRQAPDRTAKNKTPAPGVRRGDESITACQAFN